MGPTASPRRLPDGLLGALARLASHARVVVVQVLVSRNAVMVAVAHRLALVVVARSEHGFLFWRVREVRVADHVLSIYQRAAPVHAVIVNVEFVVLVDVRPAVNAVVLGARTTGDVWKLILDLGPRWPVD